MLYKEIKHALEAISQGVNPLGAFHYGNDTSLQLLARDGVYPIIHCDPLRDTPNYATGVSEVQIALGFLLQDTVDSSSIEQAILVEDMEDLANQFFMLLAEHDLFEEVRPSRQPVYKWTSSLLTGMACTFTAKIPMSLCY